MNSVGWFEIYVDDMERAKKFYEGVFQRKLERLINPETEASNIDMWSFEGNLEKYGAAGALVHMKGYPAGQNSVLVYFGCEDCAVEEKRVVDFGGKIERPKFDIGQHGYASLVIDTEGNVFGLHSMK